MKLDDYICAGLFVVAFAVALVLPGDAILHAEQPEVYALPVTHTVTLTAVPVDASDYQAASPCAAVAWTVSDANKATLTPLEGGMSATLTPLAAGAVTVTATCGPLTQTLAVQIVGQAVALRIGIGEPVAK